MESKLVLKGIWEFKLIDKKSGKVLEEKKVKNLIVNVGKQIVAKLLNGISTQYFSYIGIGTGTTAPTASDTSLESEVDNQLATTSYEADYKAVWEKTFTFTSAYTITEAGIFDSNTSGANMLNRVVFSGINVDASTDLYVKVTVEVKSSV